MLIPWIYNDLFDSHNFAKLFTLALSLAIAQAVVASFIKNRNAALSLWFVSLIPLALVVFENTRPESQNNARLSLGLGASGSSTNVLWLTNDFLATGSGNAMFSNSSPWVVVPVLPTQTNVFLWFQLFNESDNAAEEADVRAVIGRDVGCLPDPSWTMVIDEKGQADLTWRQPFLLSQGAEWLPKIAFPASVPIDKIWGQRFPVAVRVRAKNSPPKTVSFWMCFVRAETNTLKCLGAYSAKQIEFVGTNEVRFTFPKP